MAVNDRESYPAYNKNCNVYHKRGYLANVCITSKKKEFINKYRKQGKKYEQSISNQNVSIKRINIIKMNKNNLKVQRLD